MWETDEHEIQTLLQKYSSANNDNEELKKEHRHLASLYHDPNVIPWKSVLFAAAGNFFEYYDFALLGYFTDEIGEAFFPSSSGIMSTLEVFTIFAVGFLARPFGGAFFGYLGDKFGRRFALKLSIFMMALPTFLTGCLPTYAEISWAAPVLLLILRIIQGLSTGGENANAYVYVYEVATKGSQGFGLAVVAISSSGTLLASLLHVLLEASCTHAELYSWGWRIPFWLGIILVLFTFFAQKNLQPTHDFEVMTETSTIIDNPLSYALKHHSSVLIKFFFGGAIQHGGNYLIWVFIPDYLEDEDLNGRFNDSWSYTFNIINLILTYPIYILMGKFVDNSEYGLKFGLYFGSISVTIFGPIIFYLLAVENNIWVLGLLQLSLGILHACILGVIYYWYIHILVPDPRTRVTLYGIGYNLSSAAFSGTATLIGTAFIDVFGNINGMIVTGCWLSVLGLFGIITFYYVFKHPERARRNTWQELDNIEEEQQHDNKESQPFIKNKKISNHKNDDTDHEEDSDHDLRQINNNNNNSNNNITITKDGYETIE